MKLTAIIIFPSKVLKFLLTIGLDLWQVLGFFFFTIRICIRRIRIWILGCAPAICSSYHFSVWVSCWPRVLWRLRRVPCCIISRWLIPRAIIWAVFNMSAIICVIVIFHPNSITVDTIFIDAFAIIGFSLNIIERRIVHEWHLSTCFKYSERFSTKHRISGIQGWVTIESIARASIWAIIHTWTILKLHIYQIKGQDRSNNEPWSRNDIQRNNHFHRFCRTFHNCQDTYRDALKNLNRNIPYRLKFFILLEWFWLFPACWFSDILRVHLQNATRKLHNIHFRRV